MLPMPADPRLMLRLIRRQTSGSRRQSFLFILCVALSMVTLVSLGSFSRGVHSSLLRDGRALHAADIIIHSRSPFSPFLLSEVEKLQRKGELKSARTYEFYSVVRSVSNSHEGGKSLLAGIKVVEAGYPFYGRVLLASGRPLAEVLTPGNIVVEQLLLDRLGLRVGERLRIGNTTLTIGDVLLSEPDRPVNFFALGPRVFVSAGDLAALGLIGRGSRVGYAILAKLRDQGALERIAEKLRGTAQKEREQVDTYLSADSRVKRFFDNLLFFLNLIGIFTLLLAGIGIQSTLTALLREQERSIAIMKALGAGSRFISGHYFGLSAILGLAGTSLGIAASFLLQRFLPALFRGLLPPGVEVSIAGDALLEGVILGFMVVLLFTALPLYRLRELKPRAIFGKEEQGRLDSRPTRSIAAGLILFFIALVFWRIRELNTGLYFLLGVGLLILLALLGSAGVLRLLSKLPARSLVLRQALKGLFRPRSATRSIVVTLTASLAVIFSFTIIEKNLDADFIRSYPPDAPNLFFVDIQPDQKQAFLQTLGKNAACYPVVRGTVVTIEGQPIDHEQERRKRGDNLGREFNLTYREHLLEDERIVEGKNLFRADWPQEQVSVLDTVLKMHGMRLGDRISFRIQGLVVEARIASIRTRTRAALQPFFYFVFPEKLLKDAPQTLFAAVRVEQKRIAPLQNRIVDNFPNVSVIDLTETVSIFARVLGKLSKIIRFFTLFSVAAGILIIVSSVFATRYSRIREAVYYTILGARKRFVLAVFALESLLLGLASSLLAMSLAQAGSWIVCRRVLDVAYRPFPGTSLLMVLGTTLMVVGVGGAASAAIVRRKPADFLRELAEE